MEKKNKKGFTLAELLIVVAIVAILVMISFSIFTGQLKKARLSVNMANARAAYAAAVASFYSDNCNPPQLYTYDIASGTATKQDPFVDMGSEYWNEHFIYESKFQDWTNTELEYGIATSWQVIFYTDGKINLRAIFDGE